ncbi:MAG: hypothetical protein Ct9H300mP28_08360 [Pseudomonadota bacterium]|nr:MAG: hypothetical protein Ct9H300mP28_08360 [Pseudomonadota bacterium]
MANWIPELIRAAGLEQASLVGHSMGALVALECAARFSENVSSLCLIGSAAKMPVTRIAGCISERRSACF